MHTFVFTVPLIQLLAGSASAILDGIDARDVYEEMEHVLVDNSGTNFDGFIGAVSPCSNYFQDRTGIEGEQSSAQWVRLVFHDFVTADVAAGTGYEASWDVLNAIRRMLMSHAAALMARLPMRETELRMLAYLSMILWDS